MLHSIIPAKCGIFSLAELWPIVGDQLLEQSMGSPRAANSWHNSAIVLEAVVEDIIITSGHLE